MNIEIPVYNDDTGGKWLRCSHQDIIDLDFMHQITSEDTRMSPNWVYLDAKQALQSDAAKFMSLLLSNRPDVNVSFDRNKAKISSIHKMPAYSWAMLNYTLAPGRVVKLDEAWRINSISHAGRGKVFLSAEAA